MDADIPPRVEYDFDVFSPEPFDDYDSISAPVLPNTANILNLEDERGVPSVVHESEEERFLGQDYQTDEDGFLENELDQGSEDDEGPQVGVCFIYG